MAAVADVVKDRDGAPGEGSELLVEAALVGLHDQQVGGVLDGHQAVGVLALVMQGIGGDFPPQLVQPVQRGTERADLIGAGVHVSLGQDTTAGWSITASRCNFGLL